jgi:hypothetical protein
MILVLFRRKHMKFLKLAVAALALGSFGTYAAHAAQICPVLNGGSTVGGGVLSSTYLADQIGQNNEGCNVLITFASNGSIGTTNPNAAPSYDSGGDDNLVGILNNTGSTIFSINLSSSSQDIFGFDGDGACQTGGYTVNGLAPCSSEDASEYGPASVTFTNINAADSSGTVNFAGGIAAGSSAFFALEGPVDVNLVVTSSAPEPSSLMLLGTGILGLGGMVRRKLTA